MLLEAAATIHIVANDFTSTDAGSTLQINGVGLFVLQANQFVGNRGDSILRFANSRHSGLPDPACTCKDNPTAIAPIASGTSCTRRATIMICSAASTQACVPSGYNRYVFHLDTNSDDGLMSRTRVYMGDERGNHFTHPDGTRSDITDPSVTAACAWGIS